jgi:hypothetical protein
MKKLIITLFLSIILASIAFAWLSLTGRMQIHTGNTAGKNKMNDAAAKFKKLHLKASEAKRFAIANGYNNSFCFLIDMSLPSGEDRFIVYDLKKDTIRKTGLVTHGRCNEDWLAGRRYGNTVGCGCTSLDKYKIGLAYTGRFGLAFKLHGLEKTNDNAFQRYVVLHAHDCVPLTEVNNEICQSDGCPTVSPGFLKALEPMIKGSGKPVLLWIFE